MQNTDKDNIVKDTDNDKPKKTGIGVNGNLIPASMRSPEERKEIGRKGGKKYGERVQREKNMQECMRALLNLTMSKKKATENLEGYEDLLSDNPTIMEVLNLVQVREAQQGNTKAFEVVRDTAGFKPVDQIQTDVNIMSDQDKALLEKVAKRTGVNPDQS